MKTVKQIPYCKVSKAFDHEKCEIVQSTGEEVCTTCRVGCGPTVTLSKHGSLARGLFWDPLVAPCLAQGLAQGDPQKHLKLQLINSKIYIRLSSLNRKLIHFLEFSESKVFELHICC